ERDRTGCELAAVVGAVAGGFPTPRGPTGALVLHDAVNGRLKGRRRARLTAITSGGTIPDTADYQVILEPQAQFVGTVNEDFAVESLQGDIFQLGNVSYRILRVEQGRIRVEHAHGEPPSIPFWLGEAPRPRFPSGWVRRQAVRTSGRRASRGCAPNSGRSSTRGSGRQPGG